MSTVAEIEAAKEEPQLEKLLSDVATSLESAAQPSSPKPRFAGLHAGSWTIAPDFDAPLPDEFWRGKDV